MVWTALRVTTSFMPFRNIINEWYAKDTSKKIRAVMKVKGNAGEHFDCFASVWIHEIV